MREWFSKRRAPGPKIPLVLYTRADCPLCEEMKAELAAAQLPRDWELIEVDVDGDPALVERFGESVPVLEIGGRVAFKGRLDPQLLARRFERRAAEWLARSRAGRAGPDGPAADGERDA